jgi:hypothetical protein
VTDWVDIAAASAALADFEQRLDPARPQAAGATILAYGEISAALTLDQVPALRGLVVKRMSGFADLTSTERYQTLLAEYLDRLRNLGIATIPTEAVTVGPPGRRPSVYLLQPLVPPESLGNRILHDASDKELAAAVDLVLDQALKAFVANAADPTEQVSIDAQLSNWTFPPDGSPPQLIDVGTPFIRSRDGHAFDQEILLAAVPPGIRSYYRRKGTAAAYMDDYFDPRLLAIDLLGNFHKEGAAHRLTVALAPVNAWLAGPAGEARERLGLSGSSGHGSSDSETTGGGAGGPITPAQVADYYRQDAATLDLFLRVRRIDRAVRRGLRLRYDFILPGPVDR